MAVATLDVQVASCVSSKRVVTASGTATRWSVRKRRMEMTHMQIWQGCLALLIICEGIKS